MLPHKRSFSDMENQSHTPQSEGNAKSGGKAWQHSDKGRHPGFGVGFIHKFSAVGLTDDNHFPTSVQLNLITSETNEHGKKKETPALVCDHPSRGVNETSPNSTKSPWLSIAEKIRLDLHASFQNVVNEVQSLSSNKNKIKPSFVARIGKVHFHGCDVSLNTILNEVLGVEKKKKKTFYTNVHKEYMEAVEDQVVPRTGFGNEPGIEHYNVTVLDKHGKKLKCKYSATNDGRKLELRQVESVTTQYFIADTLCLKKDFDVRLILFTRVTFKALPDKYQALKMLIESANIDPNAKRALSWPPGNDYTGDGFSVGTVWHDRLKVFKGPTMMLKFRDVDHYNFKSREAKIIKEVV